MNKTIGFIGAGNMGRAMISGIIKAELIKRENIRASVRSDRSKKTLREKFDIRVTLNNKEVSRESDYLIIGVKPNIYKEILDEIKNDIKEGALIIIIAAGVKIGFVNELLDGRHEIVRAMPNTPSMVGEGMTALSGLENIGEKEREELLSIFKSFGKVEALDENLMDAFTAIAGSSPAYVYMMIEAMADGGVLNGIQRDKAYRIVAQSILGAAKMLLETESHPGQLKDKVCSPGGTTIEAVKSLEEDGFRKSLIRAVDICSKKSASMNLENK